MGSEVREGSSKIRTETFCSCQTSVTPPCAAAEEMCGEKGDPGNRETKRCLTGGWSPAETKNLTPDPSSSQRPRRDRPWLQPGSERSGGLSPRKQEGVGREARAPPTWEADLVPSPSHQDSPNLSRLRESPPCQMRRCWGHRSSEPSPASPRQGRSHGAIWVWGQGLGLARGSYLKTNFFFSH